MLGWGPFLRNVVASNNIVRRCNKGVIVSVVEGAKSTMISGNIFDSVPGGAIMGQEWNKPVTADMLGKGKNPYPHLTLLNNTRI